MDPDCHGVAGRVRQFEHIVTLRMRQRRGFLMRFVMIGTPSAAAPLPRWAFTAYVPPGRPARGRVGRILSLLRTALAAQLIRQPR